MSLTTSNETGATIITEEPAEPAFTNEYVDRALAELEEEGVDVTGADFEPVDVTLEPGGA
jgi:NitT/TauT family transport system substrate-binding protein